MSDSRLRVDPTFLVRTLIALLLVGAAVLKAHVLLTDPLASHALGPRWVAITTVEFEFLLGAWLLSGAFAIASSWTALFAFAVFAAVAFMKGIWGEESCKCFGKLAVSPWITFIVDCVAVAALFRFRSSFAPTTSIPRLRGLGMCGMALLIASVAAFKMATPSWSVAADVKGLACEQSKFDFGVLAEQRAGSAEHTFTLKNTSSHPIAITKNSSTCGCTVADVPTDVVQPNQVAKIRVTADWSNRPGHHMEEVQLTTDDPLTKQIVLSVSGNVRATAAVSNRVTHLGLMEFGGTVQRVISVNAGSQRGFRITGIKPSSDRLSVLRIGSSNQPDANLPIEGPPGAFMITFASGGLSGPFAEQLVFETNIPGQPTLTAQVTGQVKRPIAATPASMLFRPGNGGYETQVINIVSPLGDPAVSVRGSEFAIEKGAGLSRPT